MNRLHKILAMSIIPVCALLTKADSPTTQPLRVSDKQPNVLCIVADDLGYGDLGCTGCKDIPTPNIDSIAKQGVRMTGAYAYPTCSPTRAALLTGKYAERFGVSGPLMGDNPPRFDHAITIAEMLKQHGYVTGLVGKWHLGYTGDVTPNHKGFTEFYGFHGGKIDYFKQTDTAQKNNTADGKHDFYENETEIFPQGYTTDLFTDRACTFLNQHKDQKFFLYLAYNAPHYSQIGVWQAPESYLKKFNVESQTAGRGVYAAMVNCMDDGIGKVLKQLHDLNLDNNTIVIFMSDNGGEGVADNSPFSGHKHQYAEGGIRVPLIFRFPSTLPTDKHRDEPIHTVDITPTILGALNIQPAPNQTFDGQNLWHMLTTEQPIPDRALYLGPKALRNGPWKLFNNKLFNVVDDPAEKVDQTSNQPEKLNSLTKELAEWSKKLK